MPNILRNIQATAGLQQQGTQDPVVRGIATSNTILNQIAQNTSALSSFKGDASEQQAGFTSRSNLTSQANMGTMLLNKNEPQAVEQRKLRVFPAGERVESTPDMIRREVGDKLSFVMGPGDVSSLPKKIETSEAAVVQRTSNVIQKTADTNVSKMQESNKDAVMEGADKLSSSILRSFNEGAGIISSAVNQGFENGGQILSQALESSASTLSNALENFSNSIKNSPNFQPNNATNPNTGIGGQQVDPSSMLEEFLVQQSTRDTTLNSKVETVQEKIDMVNEELSQIKTITQQALDLDTVQTTINQAIQEPRSLAEQAASSVFSINKQLVDINAYIRTVESKVDSVSLLAEQARARTR